MAENLVLATLQVNADGTITAYNRTGQAATLMERQTRQSVDGMERKTKTGFDAINVSSKRLIDGFLNLRRLISGLFIGFSVGGFVFALGQMVAAQITATSWFKSLKESAEDFFRSLAFGESDIERFSRKASEAMKAAGVTTAEELKARIAGLRDAIEKEEALLQGHSVAQTKSFLRNLTTAYFQPSKYLSEEALNLPPTDSQIVDFKKNIVVLKAALAEATEAYNKMGAAAAKAMAPAIDTGGQNDPRSLELFGGPEKFGGPPDRIAEAMKQLDFQRQETQLSSYMQEVEAGTLSWGKFNDKVETAVKRLTELGFSMAAINTIEAVQFNESLQQQLVSLDQLLQKYEMWINVLGVAAGAVSAASQAGIISAQAAFRIQHALLASEAILRGMFEQARAVQAAVTPGEQWEVPFHQAAAALFFATAAFHGIGAIAGAGGGRGGGGSRGSSFAQSGLQTPTDTVRESAPNQQITIIVEGSMIGSDPNAIARWLAEITNKARRDGMRAA